MKWRTANRIPTIKKLINNHINSAPQQYQQKYLAQPARITVKCLPTSAINFHMSKVRVIAFAFVMTLKIMKSAV